MYENKYPNYMNTTLDRLCTKGKHIKMFSRENKEHRRLGNQNGN